MDTRRLKRKAAAVAQLSRRERCYFILAETKIRTINEYTNEETTHSGGRDRLDKG